MVTRRKIKKKTAKNRKPARTRKSIASTRLKRVSLQEKKEMLGRPETVVEQTKFSTVESPQPQRIAAQELPDEHGRDRIVLQVRDPYWIHAYWQVSSRAYERLKNELRDDFYKARRILRIYDVSYIIFNGTNAHRFFDIQINEHAHNWYIDTGGPGRSWCVDLGLLLPDGRFIVVVRSNTVTTPIDGPSWITDEEWMIPEDMFARLYGMGFGLGKSSPVGPGWQKKVRKELFSGILASPGISSLASPVKKSPSGKKETK